MLHTMQPFIKLSPSWSQFIGAFRRRQTNRQEQSLRLFHWNLETLWSWDDKKCFEQEVTWAFQSQSPQQTMIKVNMVSYHHLMFGVCHLCWMMRKHRKSSRVNLVLLGDQKEAQEKRRGCCQLKGSTSEKKRLSLNILVSSLPSADSHQLIAVRKAQRGRSTMIWSVMSHKSQLKVRSKL